MNWFLHHGTRKLPFLFSLVNMGPRPFDIVIQFLAQYIDVLLANLASFNKVFREVEISWMKYQFAVTLENFVSAISEDIKR